MITLYAVPTAFAGAFLWVLLVQYLTARDDARRWNVKAAPFGTLVRNTLFGIAMVGFTVLAKPLAALRNRRGDGISNVTILWSNILLPPALRPR